VRDKIKAYEIGSSLFLLTMTLHNAKETFDSDQDYSKKAYSAAQRIHNSLSDSSHSFDFEISSFEEFQKDCSTAVRQLTDRFLSRYPDLRDFIRFGRITSSLIISTHLPDMPELNKELIDIVSRNGVSHEVIEDLIQYRRDLEPSVLQDRFDKICNDMATENNNIVNQTFNIAGGYINTNTGTYIQNINMSQDLTDATDINDVAARIKSSIDHLQQQGKTSEDAQSQVGKDIEIQARNNPIINEKLLKWGQSLGAATVSDVVKGLVKLAIRSAGVPLP
jgi:hypothetical protein